MQQIYLDNSATTRVCPEAAQAALRLMTEAYGNPSSLHAMGFAAETALRTARDQVSRVLGVSPEEVCFTSGGTEANNLALFGAAHARRKRGKRIVSTMIEHPSVLNVLNALELEGFSVVYLKPDKEGRIAPEQLFEAVNGETILVSLMAVNNEVGSILPIEAARAAIDRAKAPALLHADAVQAFGKLPLSPRRLGVDLMTVSAHKIHGPKGVGALYVKKGAVLRPVLFGGGQEKNLRPGTEGLPLIAAFGAACAALPDQKESLAHAETLRALLRERTKALPGVEWNSPADGLPYLVSLSAAGVKAETMLHFLSDKGIYISSGSACSKGSQSHVLGAMGLSSSRIGSALRVSFSRCTTEEEVLAFCEALGEGLSSLQKIR